MISILEYNGLRKEVRVSDDIVALSKLVDSQAANEDNVFNDEEFSHNYTKLQEYYDSFAIDEFKKQDIYIEGFIQHTQEMKERNVLNYARFIDFN